MTAAQSYVGQPVNRVDGRLKVTGAARYAAEAQLPDMAYGCLVLSTIASGEIVRVDAVQALRAPGVLAVISHLNSERIRFDEQMRAQVDPDVGQPLLPFQNEQVFHHGQPVAMVVADTFERAQLAARLVRLEYRERRPTTTFAVAQGNAHPPGQPNGSKSEALAASVYRRGNLKRGLATAEVRVEATYTHPMVHHNPMEPHATVAVWSGQKLTLYDKTQWVDNVRDQVAGAFGMSSDDVRVISPFVGGAFGSALRAWPHVYAAAIAARQAGRPVKLVLTRAQMFTVPGFRPHTRQSVTLGARHDGTLTAIRHEGLQQTSTYEEYTESLLDASRYLYACPNVETRYQLCAMNVNTPGSMRGPGECSGVYALESALDELAAALRLDPLELRLRNYTETDPEADREYSSKSLRACYLKAAERFGWSQRQPQPRSMRAGRLLVGYGMASATWPTYRQSATVRVQLRPDGTAVVQTAASDIGPGTYTVMTQIAADALGLPIERVRFELGDTRLPESPVEGGSMMVASVGNAVHEAALAARDESIRLAVEDSAGPLHRAKPKNVTVHQGRLSLAADPERSTTYQQVFERNRPEGIDITRKSKPSDKSEKKFSMRAFGAHFAEVQVDPEFGTVRVTRFVSGLAAGRIINPKTAVSQAVGGIVQGIGMALLEETVLDERNARVVNASMADYHVPVHADIPAIEAFYLDELDPHVNRLGAKGLAELSIVGTAAAVANAVYHATGRRVRDLPITPEKLL